MWRPGCKAAQSRKLLRFFSLNQKFNGLYPSFWAEQAPNQGSALLGFIFPLYLSSLSHPLLPGWKFGIRQDEVGKENTFPVCHPALVHRRIYTILAALMSDKWI